jgi:predicted Zn-dependent protease
MGRPSIFSTLMLAAFVGLLPAAAGPGAAAARDVPALDSLGDALKDKFKTTRTTPAKPEEAAGKVLATLAEGSKGDSRQQEIDLGRGVTAMMLGALDLVDDPGLQRYVGKVGMVVATRGERPKLPWRFVIVDTPSINAFAVPGGVVLITRGLYDLLETEDELAAVIGHEIAHVQRKHHYEVMRQQKLVGALSDAAASQVTVDNAMLDKLWSRATEVMTRGLDKSAEYEADRDGMVLAARAGYDSSALLTVLEKIGASAARGSDASMLYSTHPAPAARLAALGDAVTPELEAAARPSPAAPRLRAPTATAR